MSEFKIKLKQQQIKLNTRNTSENQSFRLTKHRRDIVEGNGLGGAAIGRPDELYVCQNGLLDVVSGQRWNGGDNGHVLEDVTRPHFGESLPTNGTAVLDIEAHLNVVEVDSFAENDQLAAAETRS